MKQTLLLFLATASLTSCESLGLKDEKFTHEVKNVGEDEFFTFENKKQPSFVFFTIEGELSHDAKLLWRDHMPETDTVFTSPNAIALPKGKVKITNLRGDYYSKKLFVKYVSLNDSTSGNLLIKVKM